MTVTAGRPAPATRPPAARRAVAPPPEPRAGRGGWPLALALLVLTATATTALAGIFDGALWWFLSVGIAAAVLLGCAALRSLGVPAWLAPAGGAVIATAIVIPVFAGGTAWAGVIPTARTLARLHELLAASTTAIIEETIPAVQTPPLLLAVALGAAVAALAMDLLAVVARTPALCGVPALMILSIPVVVLDTGLSAWWMVLTLAAYLLLLVVAGGSLRLSAPRDVRFGMLAAAGGTVIALVVGLTAPGFGTIGLMPSGTGGSNIGNGVNPLIDLGKDLREPISVPVLDYTTNVPGGVYLRLTALDRFTGDTWTRSAQASRRLPSDGSLGAVPGLTSDVPTKKVTTTIAVGQLASKWIPLPYPSIRVTGLRGAWRISGDDLTVAARIGDDAEYQHVTAVSRVPMPTGAELRRASTRRVPEDVRRDLALPSDVPASIVDAARDAVKGARTPYQEAVDLQEYFRGGGFSYSLQTPLKEGYDGDGLKVIAKFLKVKSGYCVHFASAMAIMARILGIPARVAIGYLPGSEQPFGNPSGDKYTVTSDELHSWPELYFPGVGWLPFEPTVGQGVVPAYAQPAVPDVGATAGATAPAAPLPTATSALPDQGKEIGAEGSAARTAPSDLRAVAALLVALLILALPACAGAARAAWRRTRIRRGARPGLHAWRALDALGRDLRLDAGAGRTVRQQARLLDHGGQVGAAVACLRDAAEAELYGRPHEAGDRERRMLLAALDVAAAGLRARVSPGRRILARVLPVSLVTPPALSASRRTTTA